MIVSIDAELQRTIGAHGQVLRPRGVLARRRHLLTNTGPLAGALEIDEIHPTPESPWLVQPFVEGETVCTYSTVHEGKVTSHLLYRIPRQWKHATGIGFESIDATESLRLIEPVVAELGYTGQISFDFIITDDGLSYRGVQPAADRRRAADAARRAASGILDPGGDTYVLRPGAQVQLDLAVLADGFADHLHRLPDTIHDLAQVEDAGKGWRDPMPTLYSALAVAHFAGEPQREQQAFEDAMAADMNWDGEPIEGMSDADRRLLGELTAG